MKRVIRLLLASVLGYLILVLIAVYADQHPNFAAALGGHNIVLLLFVIIPACYFVLGFIPFFGRKPPENRENAKK